MKLIVTGLEDSGKGIKLAHIYESVLLRNAKWIRKGLPPRPIVSVLPLTPFAFEWAKELNVPVVDWSGSTTVIEDLEKLASCDLFLDEIGTYFDSRTYSQLPLSTRLWLAQASKLGVDIYGSAQDFMQVDVSFRRLTNVLLEVTKIAGSARPDKTRPPVKRVWGLCMERELNPMGYSEESKYASQKGFPKFWFIRKHYCGIYYTNKRVPKGELPPFRHVARKCELEGCKMSPHMVLNGHHYKITHV